MRGIREDTQGNLKTRSHRCCSSTPSSGEAGSTQVPSSSDRIGARWPVCVRLARDPSVRRAGALMRCCRDPRAGFPEGLRGSVLSSRQDLGLASRQVQVSRASC